MRKSAYAILFSGACALALGASAIAKHHTKMDVEIRTFYETAVADFLKCDPGSIGKHSTEKKTGYYPDSLELHDESSAESRQMEVEFCEGGGKHELTYEIADIIGLEDAAVVLGTGRYKRTEPDGAVSIDTDYSFTEVLVKTDDGWKFRHSHVGVAVPMEEAAGEE
ncbi:MAG: nuclear transport factor 2 family protein [Parvularculaceae bacterium]